VKIERQFTVQSFLASLNGTLHLSWQMNEVVIYIFLVYSCLQISFQLLKKKS